MDAIRPSRTPIATWAKVGVTGAFALLAALAYLFSVSNGVVAGAIVGLPGRERDVIVAEHRGLLWLGVCAGLQVSEVAAIFWLLSFGEDAGRLARFTARGIVAAVVSVGTTSMSVWVMFNVLRHFHC